MCEVVGLSTRKGSDWVLDQCNGTSVIVDEMIGHSPAPQLTPIPLPLSQLVHPVNIKAGVQLLSQYCTKTNQPCPKPRNGMKIIT